MPWVNPVRLIGGPGQQHDSTQAEDLIDGIKAQAVIADKGYDTNKIEAKIAEQGSEVVIPPKRNRKSPRTYDKELYKKRNLIQRFFAKLKQFRQVATRYDKLLVNYKGFVNLPRSSSR